MTHSLIGADRTTHFKIVAVALVSAIVLVMVGITARVVDSDTATARLQTDGPVLKAGKPAFVDFWAPWCGPCRIIGPIVEELAPNYKEKAVIAKMNVDDNPEVAQKYGVTSIPTLMMFKDGKLVDRVVGAMPKNQLQSFIDRNL